MTGHLQGNIYIDIYIYIIHIDILSVREEGEEWKINL